MNLLLLLALVAYASAVKVQYDLDRTIELVPRAEVDEAAHLTSQRLLQTMTHFIAAFNNQDALDVAALWSGEESVLVRNGAPRAKGPSDIVAAFTSLWTAHPSLRLFLVEDTLAASPFTDGNNVVVARVDVQELGEDKGWVSVVVSLAQNDGIARMEWMTAADDVLPL